ncbi:MAG TPA: hypothetical protein VLX67_04310 [Stellaceae bacterium]|nr:hypothetical protein [Stellaceae bacterium]
MQELDRQPVLLPQTLDPVSRRRLAIFVFKLLMLGPIAVAFASQQHFSIIAAAGYFCSWYVLFSFIAALIQRHKLNAAVLTAWDEAAGFLGIALASHLLDTLAG